MSKLFTSRLKFDLEEVVENNPKGVEIEARLRKLNPKQIELLDEYLTNSNFKTSTSFTIDYYLDGNKRVTQEGDKYYAINKKNILSKILFVTNRDIKISASYESTPENVKAPLNYNLKRVKDRISYYDGNFRIDVTKVNNDNKEVEIEVLDNTKFDPDAFENKINELYEHMTDDRDEMVKFLNRILLKFPSDDVKRLYGILSRPRDLLIGDMTKNGLMKNYTVSVKADGLQKLIVMYNYKAYLFVIKDSIDESFTFITSYENENFNNTVIIGELIKDELYLPFDCLIYQEKDVRNENYLERLQYLTDFYDLKLSNINIKQKKIFTYANDEESFYEAMNMALDTEQKVEYGTDGLIFTPIYSPYVTIGQKLPASNQKDRFLGKYPDVCKYKPPEKLTIDFLVKEDGLYAKEGKFTGNQRYPFTAKNYQYERKYIDKVVEFSPHQIDKDIIYKPLQVRVDKPFPNKTKQIMDNWILIHDPITLPTMRGKNVQLMRRYHNQIKTDLLRNISGYVIDIGAGAGGVFNKYIANKNIKKVLSIEPNVEFGKEFERRRMNLQKPDQFKLIEAGGEDNEKIIEAAKNFFPESFGENDLNICFHISLSFFWKDKEMLSSLARTILDIEKYYQGEGKVKIVYLTIEGHLLNNLFETQGNTVILNNIVLKRINDNQVFIDIKDSVTVHDQIEYLVYLKELWALVNYKPLFQYEAINDKASGYILSLPEITYSKLFVYGIAEKSKEKISIINEIDNREDCLHIDQKRGNRTKYGIQAKGDDERLKYKDNYYRIGTLGSKDKIYHSILKLLTKKYRESNVYTRVELGNELKEKLHSSRDLEYISKRLGIGIKIINTDKHYNKDMNKYILLYECKDDIYEPIIYHDGIDHLTFKL